MRKTESDEPLRTSWEAVDDRCTDERSALDRGLFLLLTGAARGIGEGIARAFHREGATVLLTDVRDELDIRPVRGRS